MPLRIERTADELGFEAHAVLQQLSGELCVDTFALKEVQSRTAIIDQQARDLAAAAARTEAADRAWDALAASIYELDAHAQDTLTAKSEIQAAAYQLGRGLAEVYWALDPAAPCVPSTAECWEFLLGQHRCQELTRLAGRLSGYLNPYGPPAIAGTLCLWQLVAKDPQW